MKNITDKTLKRLTAKGNVVVELSGKWCCWCREMEKSIAEVVGEFPDVKFYTYNTDTESKLTEKHKIDGIPALLFFKGGKFVKKYIGYVPANRLRTMLKRYF